MKIKKIINNNIVCVLDEKGRELIVTGKGIGFGNKPGDEVDKDKIRKTYTMTGSAVRKKFLELLEEIPYEHIKLTDDFIDMIKKNLQTELNEKLLITLSDHISFAIARKGKGIEFSNPLITSIMEYYPDEYRLGEMCLDMIDKRLGVRLKSDEAGFIAMHIINAELNTNMNEVYDITNLIEGCINVTEYYYDRKFDRKSLDFNRFIVHLRYFAQRVFTDDEHKKSDDAAEHTFHRLIKETCKNHYKCAECIAEYIKNTFNKDVTEEELVYLTIHLKRINS